MNLTSLTKRGTLKAKIVMLNLLRRIEFPDHLQASGPVIKATLLCHVSDYQGIVQQARQEADEILKQARKDADAIRSAARLEALDELRADLAAMRVLVEAETKEYKEKATTVCLEICSTLLEQMMSESDGQSKMRVLIEALLNRSHSARELNLQAHPDQVDLVQSTLTEVLGQQLNYRKCFVQGDEQLQLFELNITTANGAKIIVSIQNLLHMYRDEIESLGPEIKQAFTGIGEVNESTA